MRTCLKESVSFWSVIQTQKEKERVEWIAGSEYTRELAAPHKEDSPCVLHPRSTNIFFELFLDNESNIADEGCWKRIHTRLGDAPPPPPRRTAPPSLNISVHLIFNHRESP